MSDNITFYIKDGITYYSCGCKDNVIGGNYIFKPCSLNCVVYKYALEQSHKQGNILSIQEV